VSRHVSAPDGNPVPPPNQLPADLLDVLVAAADVWPVPHVDEEDVQRAGRVHQSPTGPPV